MTFERKRCIASLLLVGFCVAGVVGCRRSKPDGAGDMSAPRDKVTSPQLAAMKWTGSSEDQAQVKVFYDTRQDALAWTYNGEVTPQAQALIELFTNAAQKGLKPEEYDASKWPQRVQKIATIRSSADTSANAQENLAQFDTVVTVAALRYISDLHEGRVNPQQLNFDIETPEKRAAFNAAGVLASVVQAGDVPAALASVEPQSPLYAATERALPRYLQLAQMPTQPLPTVDKTVAVGGSYPAVSALAARLQMEDGGVSAEAAAATTYDAGIASAVTAYQSRHGITPDGTLTAATIVSLNVPMTMRVQQMNDTLERFRWLPEEYVQPRVLVNLPEFEVRTYEADHTPAFTMKVVCGQAAGGHDTPMFVKEMKYVIFRPFWGLPVSIVKKELVHHLTGDGGQAYMDRHNYQVINAQGDVVTDWTAEDLQHSRYQVRQKPGPGNSLGLVKFMFPNVYDVYMHSTPEMNLFSLTRRDRSHGCVRLNNAEQMADWVLRDQGEWTPDKIHDAMFGTGNSKQVNLPKPLPVDILYLTALANEDGTMHFFDDIYGYDKQLDAVLAKGLPYPTTAAKVNSKLPPGSTD